MVFQVPTGAAINRLIRHDRRVLVNVVRAAFAAWSDRLLAVVVVWVGIAGLRSWLGDHAGATAAWAALGGGAAFGIVAGRLVAARLAFHAFDGALAADALRRPVRVRYAGACHLTGLAAVLAVAAIVQSSALVAALPGYLAGALVGHATASLRVPGLAAGGARLRWRMQSRTHRPLGGALGAAALLTLLALLAGTTSEGTVVVAAGLGAAAMTWVLTTVDADIVRFRALAGHGAARTLRDQAAACVTFAGLAVPAGWLACGPEAAGVIGLVALAALLLLSLRILVYRLYRPRFADLLVTTVVALLLVVGFTAPLFLPVVALGLLWQLQRHAAARTWLLA